MSEKPSDPTTIRSGWNLSAVSRISPEGEPYLETAETFQFGKAFLTIIDTHVTTIVSCCFLFLFGTGPVKGFAVTLVIGLFANVFTAVFVSRTIFNWELGGQKRAVTLSI